jgi:hypothetical protein
MRSRSLKLLLGISLALCAAMLVLWTASYLLPWSTTTYLTQHRNSTGMIETVARRGWMIESRDGHFRITSFKQNLLWQVPYVRLILLLVFLWGIPLLMLERRKKRIAQGLCINCGYDLRASPERCPECGMVTNRIPAESTP